MVIGEKTDVFQSEDVYGIVEEQVGFLKVYRGGNLVYEGRVEVFPDGGRIKVYFNRIARGMLSPGELPTQTGLTSNPAGVAELETEVEDEDGTFLGDFPLIRVWQGAGVFDQTGKVFTTEPINGHACPQMLLFLSHSARYSFTAEIG